MIVCKNGVPTCPVNCMYCMAQKIDIRSKYWKNTARIGMNKSCVFFNRLPQDPKLEDMNLPWNLLDGEYLGFQGITDCFWDIFLDDLKFLVKMVKEKNIRKLCLISKIPLTDEQLKILIEIKEKLVVCYSVTGLDKLEKTSTKDRIKSLVNLRNAGIDSFPVIHPYIHGYCDIESVMKELYINNFHEVNWKGFRYNSQNMKILENYIPKEILNQYIGSGEEEEILIGNDYIEKIAQKYDIKFVDLKEYLHRHTKIKLKINSTKEEYEVKIREQVLALSKQCVFSTSGKKEEVIENCINRRCDNIEFI